METQPTPQDPREAAALLETMTSDRDRLADRAKAPTWLPLGFGLIAAAYVAGPASSEDWRRFILIAAILGTLAMLAAYRRATGIRLTGVGPKGGLLFALAIVVVLGLLSISFGLVASGLGWWVIATAAVAFAAVAWITRTMTDIARARITRA